MRLRKGGFMCAHQDLNLIIHLYARLLLGVFWALSFKPFARLSLTKLLELELWSIRVMVL